MSFEQILVIVGCFMYINLFGSLYGKYRVGLREISALPEDRRKASASRLSSFLAGSLVLMFSLGVALFLFGAWSFNLIG